MKVAGLEIILVQQSPWKYNNIMSVAQDKVGGAKQRNPETDIVSECFETKVEYLQKVTCYPLKTKVFHISSMHNK